MSYAAATTPLFYESPTTPARSARSVWAPTLLVAVPRAVLAYFSSLPWADVIAAAEHGRDGLTIESTLPPRYMGWPNEKNPRPDVAFLREGEGDWKGRTLLYQQNW